MQAFIVISDGANEIRIPVSARYQGPEPVVPAPTTPAPSHTYTDDFKARVVDLAGKSGQKRVAAFLGVPVHLVKTWCFEANCAEVGLG